VANSPVLPFSRSLAVLSAGGAGQLNLAFLFLLFSALGLRNLVVFLGSVRLLYLPVECRHEILVCRACCSTATVSPYLPPFFFFEKFNSLFLSAFTREKTTMSNGETFLFTSESVGEGHPGTSFFFFRKGFFWSVDFHANPKSSPFPLFPYRRPLYL